MPRLERDNRREEVEDEAAEVTPGWEQRRQTDSSFLREDDDAAGDESGAEQVEEVTTDRALDFGRFAHQAYQAEADDRFDDVQAERPVRVQSADSEADGRVDLVINENKLFDFKTNDMRDWSDSQAHRMGDEHGRQMRGYIDSSDTPADAHGWLVSTVPPASESARDAYASAAGAHDVGVIYTRSEQPADVVDSIADVIEEEGEETAS